MTRIFNDDPDALKRLNEKLDKLIDEKKYWKALKPETRDYSANETDNMKRWYMLQNYNQNINQLKKRIIKLEALKANNIDLVRNTTFKNGRKVFYYSEGDKK